MRVRSMLFLIALAAAGAAVPAAARTQAAAAQAAPARGSAEPRALAEVRARDARIDRYFARATAALRAAAADALGEGVAPPPGALPQRPSITQLSATQLASLRRGIAQMIAWNGAPHGSAEYKRSLVYWANMHSYIGSNCSKASGINLPGMSGLTPQNATTPDELATWCTCQHGTDQFLTWHRMYLYYFEQVLKAASGDASLMLPFWDYETDGHIPPAYRAATYVDGGVTLPNPLYVANRQAQLNAGTAALDPAVTSTSNAMAKTSYKPFNSTLEQTPHGAVHCATGVQNCPSGYMGYVPSAGNDPIFYSHHANIDRLYECWVRVNPSQRLPDKSLWSKQFSFIDGTGALVTRTVGDMLTTAQLGYGYAAGGGCPVALRLPPKLLLQEAPIRIYDVSGPVTLGEGVTRVPLRIAPDTRKNLLKAVPGRATPARQVLVLDKLTYDELPSVLYKVYLTLNGKRQLVGVVNFFNATAPHQDMPGMDMASTQSPSFDVTDALQALGSGDVQLAIEPSSGVTGAPALLGTVKANARANVRIAAVRIETH